MSTTLSSILHLKDASKNTTPKMAISEEDRRNYLQELQAQTTLAMIPGMVAILLLALVGLIGNSLVLYVYSRKFVLNGTRVLILSIAAFDLITNVFVIPGEVYSMFNVWDFDIPWLCKMRQFIKAFTTIVSAMLLIALAVVRYRKVCVPFGWQISAHHAKIVVVALIHVSALCATPYSIINGSYTKETRHPHIFGHECTVDDAFVNTKWPLINYAFFIFLYLASSTTIVVLYLLIGIKTFRHIRKIAMRTSSSVDGNTFTSDNAVITSNSAPLENVVGASLTAGTSTLDKHDTAFSDTLDTTEKTSTSQKSVSFFQLSELGKKPPFRENTKDREIPKSERENVDNVPIEYVRHSDKSRNKSEGPNQGEVNLSTMGEPKFDDGAVQIKNLNWEAHKDEVSLQNLDCKRGDGRRERHESLKVSSLSPVTKTVHLYSTEQDKQMNINAEWKFENDHLTAYSLLSKEIDCSNDHVDNIKVAGSAASGSPTKDSEFDPKGNNSSNFTSLKDPFKCDEKMNPPKTSLNEATIQRKRNLMRTTLMLITISAVFIIGFLPYLVLAVYFTLNDDKYKNLDGVGLAFYNLFLHSFLLNSASNAIIYGVCDLTFRAKCAKILQFCCIKT